MNIKIHCPNCQQAIEYENDNADVYIACPMCSNQVYLPKAIVSPPKQKSVAWGVFKGLVLFFIVLPIVVFVGFAFFRGMITGAKQNSTRANSPTTALANQGNWQLERTVSKIDDSKGFIVSLKSSDGIVNSFGVREHPTLIIRSQELKLSYYIDYESFLGSDNINVTLRFDKNPAFDVVGTISTDGLAVFIPDMVIIGDKPRDWKSYDFINLLENGKQLVVRLTPFQANTETITFDLGGLMQTLSQTQ